MVKRSNQITNLFLWFVRAQNSTSGELDRTGSWGKGGEIDG
jgi:hypothetical protein